MRDFLDAAGVRWLVWDVQAEEMHPASRSQQHMQAFADGWLVFETADGTQRRRLRGVPPGWAELPHDELLRLMQRADPTRAPRTAASARNSPAAPAAPAPEAVKRPSSAALRSFLYPGGRLWTVAEVQDEDNRTVLRFSAGRRTLDLHSWPAEWATFDDAKLAALLDAGFSRAPSPAEEGTPARRRTDLRP